MMKKRNYQLKGKSFVWPGESVNWYFLPVPKTEGQRIRADFSSQGNRSCFASIKVEVTIGDSVWQTALFYSKPAESYILPVKATIRRAQDIDVGEQVEYTIRIV
jgi:hypothetical protein